MNEDTFQGAGGFKIFYRSWRPSAKPRGVVVVVPGFNAHSGYYSWVAEQLTAKGLAAYAVDLRGRGKSDGERYYVDSFAEYAGDVTGMVGVRRPISPSRSSRVSATLRRTLTCFTSRTRTSRVTPPPSPG